ncbi:MAG: peroxiredoxin family protein [Spirochaetia bacterium]|nr:peroxiredoxin family protein [Spirochaetia bacterium]
MIREIKKNKLTASLAMILFFAISMPVAALKIGDKAPPIILKDAKGKTFNLRNYAKQLKKGDITVFAFFSVTCKPCKKEIPELQALYDKYSKKGFNVFLISLDNSDQYSTEKVVEFINSLNANMPILFDTYKRIGKAYGIIKPDGEAVLPGLYAIDSKRKILIKHIGYSEKTIKDLEGMISK